MPMFMVSITFQLIKHFSELSSREKICFLFNHRIASPKKCFYSCQGTSWADNNSASPVKDAWNEIKTSESIAFVMQFGAEWKVNWNSIPLSWPPAGHLTLRRRSAGDFNRASKRSLKQSRAVNVSNLFHLMLVFVDPNEIVVTVKASSRKHSRGDQLALIAFLCITRSSQWNLSRLMFVVNSPLLVVN